MGAGTTAKAAAGLLGPIGALAGPIIGGLFGRSGQRDANAANARLAAENRAWQERMSNTAYQRATKDLQKAGLNRILALGQPSSTPAGNVATMQNEQAPLATGINEGVTRALSAKLIQAQTNKLNAEAAKISGDAVLGATKGKFYQWLVDKFGEAKADVITNDNTSRINTDPAKETHRKKVEVQIGNGRTWNEIGLKAVEAYAKEFPNATRKQLDKIYDDAIRRAKGNQR